MYYPSTGTMRIFNNGTWKDLCVANWDVVERNLVCQAQGYNGSSLGVHSKSGTNSLGNTTYSCEQLTQNCEEKINTEIKCSGIKTFLSPQGESLVRRMSIDTSTIIAELNLSLKKFAFDSLLMKFSHQTNSTTVNFRSPSSMEDKCLSDLLTTKHFPNANKRLSYEI